MLDDHFSLPERRFYEPREMMEVYGDCRVVVNVPLNNDLNMRAFEATSAGAILVTHTMDGLFDLIPNEHVRLVDSHDEFAWHDVVEAVLGETEPCPSAEIAAYGRAHSTYAQRASSLLAEFRTSVVRDNSDRDVARALAIGLARMGGANQIEQLRCLSAPERALRRLQATLVLGQRRARGRFRR